jgi:hypothetical protein
MNEVDIACVFAMIFPYAKEAASAANVTAFFN